MDKRFKHIRENITPRGDGNKRKMEKIIVGLINR